MDDAVVVEVGDGGEGDADEVCGVAFVVGALAADAVEELAAAAVVPNTFDNVTEASESSEPGVPKGNVLGWLPLVTLLLVAGSKKMLGSLAGSCAWTRPLSSEF